jgi:hypothetical protein
LVYRWSEPLASLVWMVWIGFSSHGSRVESQSAVCEVRSGGTQWRSHPEGTEAELFEAVVRGSLTCSELPFAFLFSEAISLLLC